MSEFFIVISHPVTEHEDMGDALQAKAVLEKHVPDAEHKVYRCKRWLAGAKHFTKAVELLRDIQNDGLTDANKDRLRILLITIGTRTPKLETLIRTSGPPEYRPPA
jgi:hypothetical protein